MFTARIESIIKFISYSQSQLDNIITLQRHIFSVFFSSFFKWNEKLVYSTFLCITMLVHSFEIVMTFLNTWIAEALQFDTVEIVLKFLDSMKQMEWKRIQFGFGGWKNGNKLRWFIHSVWNWYHFDPALKFNRKWRTYTVSGAG